MQGNSPSGTQGDVKRLRLQIWLLLKEEIYESWADLALNADYRKPAERIHFKGDKADGVWGLRRRLQVCHN